MTALILWLLASPQDDSAKAREILDAVAGAMKNAPSVAFRVTLSYGGEETPETTRVWLRRPNLARVEQSSEDSRSLHVWDGKEYWFHDVVENSYSSAKPEDAPISSLGLGPLPQLFLDRGAGGVLEEAKEVRASKEKLGSVECDLVAWKADEAEIRVWVRPDRRIARCEVRFVSEEGTDTTTIEYGPLDFSPKPGNDLFTFTPPKGAKEIKPEGEEGDLLANGSDAPDFEATDLDGKTVKLSDFKGKPVLLNFWFHG